MATDVSTPTMGAQPGPHQHDGYKTSVHYQTIGSGVDTPNISPASPRTVGNVPNLSTHAPQIRPMKPPIYVPAALRRTEKRQSPPKVDSAVDSVDGWSVGAGFRRPTGDSIETSISRIVTDDLNSDVPLSPITGPITKNHWQPDNSTTVCTASACQMPFTWFNRRHHCRKCGGIFCWQHSDKKVRLNEHALFHPEGEEQRACDRCHGHFRQWEQKRNSRTNSESSESSSALQIDTPIAAKRPEAQRVGSLATSFQGAWNWSTF